MGKKILLKWFRYLTEFVVFLLALAGYIYATEVAGEAAKFIYYNF